MRTKELSKDTYRQFLARAEEFHFGMKELEAFERYHAAALLGIHAAIAMMDAITVGTLGKRSISESHADASKLAKQACSEVRLQNTKGLNRFASLLSKKTDIAYGERFRTGDSIVLQTVRLDTERLFDWAYTHFNILATRGETENEQA